MRLDSLTWRGMVILRVRHIAFIPLIIIISLLMPAISLAADGASLTERETREAQQTALRFSKRLQETRDVAALLDEMFLPNFISHFEPGDESVPPTLYSHLTKAERLRLFIVQINIAYLMSLDVLNGNNKYLKDEGKSAFTSILPSEMAQRLREVIWQNGDLHFATQREFQERLPGIERVLREARAYLFKQGIEQTSKFQRELDDTIKGTGLNYRVKAYLGGDNIEGCEPLIGFPAHQKFIRVETPLLFGVILIKDGAQMKIVKLTPANGD